MDVSSKILVYSNLLRSKYNTTHWKSHDLNLSKLIVNRINVLKFKLNCFTMYSDHLQLFLRTINCLKYTSIVVYKYNGSSNQFRLEFNKIKIRWASLLSTLYVLLLLASLIHGIFQSPLVESFLPFTFFALRLGTYCAFLIIAQHGDLENTICLLNRMLRYEKINLSTVLRNKTGK